MGLPVFLFAKRDDQKLRSFSLDGPDAYFGQKGFEFWWKENKSLRVEIASGNLKAFFTNPVDQLETCLLSWDFNKNWLSIFRPWPGNVSVYFAPKSDCIVSSHLRFFGQIECETSPLPKLFAPDTKVTLDLDDLSFETEHFSSFDLDQPPSDVDHAAEELRTHMRSVIDAVPVNTV